MSIRSPRFLFALVTAIALPLTPSAHEDDPKIRDRKPAVAGPGYRASTWGSGGGFEVGTSTQFDAQDVTLLAWMPLDEFGSPASGSDCWGYTSPSGREYALFTHSDGTHVVEVTNPAAPNIVGYINGPDSMWRDVKVYSTFAYIVSEGGGGIQVVNLTNVDAGVVSLSTTITSGGTSATHNVAIDEESGFLYRCGGDSNGLRIYSLANPANPTFVGSWGDRYVHDVQVHTYTSGAFNGRQIAFACSGFNGGFTDTGLTVVDVTNKSNPQPIGQVSWPGAEYSHQAWLSDDLQRLFVNDELDEGGSTPTTTYVINVANINNPIYQGSFTNGNSAVGHNLYTLGDLVYEANYTSGLRVFDASIPLAATEVAYFDTAPGGDGATFNGAWSVYPYFPSGTVIVSDIERGLFVLWVGAPPVDLELVGAAPDVLDPGGLTLDLTLSEANPGDYAPGTAKLFYDAGAGTVMADLVDLGGGNFSAQLPSLPCGTNIQYYFSAESTNGIAWTEPASGGSYQAVVATDQLVSFQDAFESNNGWSVGAGGDDASTGIWVRANPVGTAAQPEDDNTAGGSQCFFTGQGSIGGGLGDNDVDGGKTTLTSPVLNLSGLTDPRISYYRWYSNGTGASPNTDVFVIDISNNGGVTWTNVEVVGPSGSGVNGGWIYNEVRVSDFVTPTANMRMRFVASDEGDGSIVEAAIDDFSVFGLECPLSADKAALTASAGGTVNFTLQGGAGLAGELYLLLGSLSGTTPGFTAGSVTVPLQQDVYFSFSLANANGPLLVNTFSALDGAGAGSAQFALAPGFTNLVGLTAHHAWLSFDAVTLDVSFASNALPLSFE